MGTAKSTNSSIHPVSYNSFESLLQRAQTGEQWAFSELYEKFRPRVAKFLFNSTGDYWLADELSNDTFMRAHGALANLQQAKESSFLSFLFRIAANLLCDHHRRKHIPTTSMEEDYWADVPEAGHSADHTPDDAFGMWVINDATDNDVYSDAPQYNMALTSWQPGPLDELTQYEFEISVFKAMSGGAIPLTTTGSDAFDYYGLFEYINGVGFTTIPEPATAVSLLAMIGMYFVCRRSR